MSDIKSKNENEISSNDKERFLKIKNIEQGILKELNDKKIDNDLLILTSEIDDTLLIMLENKVENMKFKIDNKVFNKHIKEIFSEVEKKYKFIFGDSIEIFFKKKFILSKYYIFIKITNFECIKFYCEALIKEKNNLKNCS